MVSITFFLNISNGPVICVEILSIIGILSPIVIKKKPQFKKMNKLEFFIVYIKLYIVS